MTCWQYKAALSGVQPYSASETQFAQERVPAVGALDVHVEAIEHCADCHGEQGEDLAERFAARQAPEELQVILPHCSCP